MLLSLNSHFNSDRPRLGGHELYCTCMTEDLFHLVYHQYISLHTHGQDHTVAVWDMVSHMEIFLRKMLKGHTNYVLAVDFDDKYIVSGSADKTIKVCVGEGRERRVEREEGRRQRRKGRSMHPLSSWINIIIIMYYLLSDGGKELKNQSFS